MLKLELVTTNYLDKNILRSKTLVLTFRGDQLVEGKKLEKKIN